MLDILKRKFLNKISDKKNRKINFKLKALRK